MTGTQYHEEIEVASRLAREAGRSIMQIYATSFVVSFKGKNDPVTEADTRANDLIVEGLHNVFPEDGIVAEETPDRSAATHPGRVWYIDPLDGTRDFVAKNGEFCVMIGLAVDGHSQLGVVYGPVGDILYAGITDRTAWRDDRGQRTALSVSMISDPREVRLVVSRSHRSTLIDEFRQRTGITHELRYGSVGLKVGLIATRQADVYIETSSLSSAWDACGPEAIVRGAGGRFTDMAGQAMVYGGDDLRNRKGLVASNGITHDMVITALAPLLSPPLETSESG
jgi:3'(2'), 5'-bisphosphate nucleotidase